MRLKYRADNVSLGYRSGFLSKGISEISRGGPRLGGCTSFHCSGVRLRLLGLLCTPECLAFMYLRLTWKCEVGAELALKRLISGYVVFFKGVNVESGGFRRWVGVLECPQRDTNP